MEKDDTCLFTLANKLRVIWEITHMCNYSCLHCCANASLEKKPELTIGEIINGLNNLKNYGFGSIYFSGGEPLAKEGFFEILEHTTKLIDSKNINLATNGKIITPEIAKKISSYNIGTALISLDGHTQEICEEFRGPADTFKNSLNAIEYLADENIKVRVGVVIWKKNYKHLEEFIKLGIETGADDVFFNWLIPVGRAKGSDNINVPQTEYFKIGKIINDLKEKYSGKIGVGCHRFSTLDDSNNPCQAIDRIIHLLPDGRVSPCSWIYKIDNDLISDASIKDTQLEQILSEKPFEYIRNIRESRIKNGVGPGCLAMCKSFGKDYNCHDPLYINGGDWINKEI